MTPGYLVWYRSLIEFNYVFHSVMDCLFIVFGFLIVAVVSRTGWQHHLRWASPMAASSVLTGFARLAWDLRHYFHIGTLVSSNLTGDLFNYLSNIVGIYATITLWRTLRDLARHPVSPDPFAAHPSQPGVWPPPPTVNP